MNALSGFVVRVLLWLPPCFASWYFLSILFTPPLAAIVEALLTSVFPSLIEQIAADGNQLIVVTRLVVPLPVDQGAASGDILLDLDPLKYGYCVPLYTALVLATQGKETAKTMRWLLGMLILLAVQVVGIATEIVKALAFQFDEGARAMLGFSPWGYEVVALAYQIGFLILPPVAPIVIWFGQFQENIPTLLGTHAFRKKD